MRLLNKNAWDISVKDDFLYFQMRVKLNKNKLPMYSFGKSDLDKSWEISEPEFNVIKYGNNYEKFLPLVGSNCNYVVHFPDGSLVCTGFQDYIFYFTIGNSDSTNCTLPLDLGKNEIEKSEIQIYPNPAQNELFINNAPSNSYIQFYNLQGQLILNKSLQRSSVNISALQKGLYLYRIYDANNTAVLQVKMVKE